MWSFSCFLFFGLSFFSSLSAQNVRLPPSLISGPIMLMRYSDRSPITLPCVAAGVPEPVRVWWKNNEILDLNNDNIEQSPVDESLIIISAREADQGYYQCRITNAYGIAMTNVSFLQMARMDQFLSTPGTQVQSVLLNGHVCLECQQLNSIPDASYTWSYNTTQNGNQISVTELNNIQINPYLGYLCLTNIQTGDIGSANNRTYRCNVYNGLMSTTYSGSYYRLTQAGTDGTYSSGLEFASPSILIGLEGQGIDLRCFFYGNPVPSVTWQKNNQTVGNRWSLINSNTGLRLTSGNLIQGDGGSYTCTGSNGVGPSSSYNIILVIEAVPIFLSENDRPHDMNVTDGDTVTIFCNSYAIPGATVSWFKDGVILNSGSLPPKYSISDDSYHLTISDICKTCGVDNSGDLTSIQCNATNVNGYAFAQGYVNVFEATIIISSGGRRTLNPNTNEEFECVATSDDSIPLTLYWFYNDYDIVENDDTLFVDEFGTLHVVMENDADGGRSRLGDYKCVASNGVSQSEVLYILEEPQIAERDSSCLKMQLDSSDPLPSGIYTIQTTRNNKIKVYCEMGLDGGGYTFLDPFATSKLTNSEVDSMNQEQSSFLMRVRMTDGTQPYAVLRQLPEYETIPVFVGVNDMTSSGYSSPYNEDHLGPPFIYFGFLPIVNASNNDIQGLQVNGKTVNFTNCDANPNSQFTLFPNFKELSTSDHGEGAIHPICDEIFADLPLNPSGRVMPETFFLFGELAFGGCGCYYQTDRMPGVLGLSIGFR